MRLGQKVSIHSLCAHGENMTFREKTQPRNCTNRYVHELKIIDKTIESSWFKSPAHISLFVSEQNLHHGSFSKIFVKALNRPLFMWMDRGDFMSPRKSGGRIILSDPNEFWAGDALEKLYHPYDRKNSQPRRRRIK
jgi:hypothetical protein